MKRKWDCRDHEGFCESCAFGPNQCDLSLGIGAQPPYRGMIGQLITCPEWRGNEDEAVAEARAKSGDARHLMDVLEREGYTVLSAGSVGQALEVLRHLRQ